MFDDLPDDGEWEPFVLSLLDELKQWAVKDWKNEKDVVFENEIVNELDDFALWLFDGVDFEKIVDLFESGFGVGWFWFDDLDGVLVFFVVLAVAEKDLSEGSFA